MRVRVGRYMNIKYWWHIYLTVFAFPDGFDFSEGWKKHVEESEKKTRDLLDSYYKKCQAKNVGDFKISVKNFVYTYIAEKQEWG